MEILNSLSDDLYLSSKLKAMNGGDVIYISGFDNVVKFRFMKLYYGSHTICGNEYNHNMFYHKDMYLKSVCLNTDMNSAIELLSKLEDDNGPMFQIDRDTYMYMATKINKVKLPFDYEIMSDTSFLIKGDKVDEYYRGKMINSHKIENSIEVLHKLLIHGYKCNMVTDSFYFVYGS